MATIRDPAFWKRFSIAVHLDEEAAAASAQSPAKELKHSDSWLAREQAKRKRRTCICWSFWFGFGGFVAGLVVLILWLKSSGLLAKLKDAMFPHTDDSS